MESLVNYGSDDDNDSPSPAKEMGGAYGPGRTNSNEDNYEAVVMDMSETLLNSGRIPLPKSGRFKSCRGSGRPAIAYNCFSGVDSNASSRSESPKPPKRRSPDAPPLKSRTSDDDEAVRRKDRDRHGSRAGRDRERDREHSRSRSGSRNELERSRAAGRERHYRGSSGGRDHDHDRRDRDRARDRDRDRDRGRGRGRDRDERHGSRRGDDRRKRSRSRSGSRSGSGSDSPSGSPSASPSRGPDKYRRRADKRRNHRKDAPSSSGSKNRGDRNRDRDNNSSNRGSGGRSGGRPGGFYHSKINNKINVLERLGIALKPLDAAANPQALAQRAGEQQAAQVKLASGVELPSYLNPAATNRFAEHMQKKRLLWGARKDEPAAAAAKSTDPMSSKWQGTTFAQDHDGKVAAKFNRLMGIKSASDNVPEAKPDVKKGDDIIKKQEEMFHNMESQYEVARLATHTHRGLGLGFGAFQQR